MSVNDQCRENKADEKDKKNYVINCKLGKQSNWLDSNLKSLFLPLFPPGCQNLSDETLFSCGRHITSLRHLNLQQCQQITDGGVQVIFFSFLRLLKAFRMWGSPLKFLSPRNFTLASLLMFFFFLSFPPHFQALAQGCPDIEFLCLSNCTHLTGK